MTKQKKTTAAAPVALAQPPPYIPKTPINDEMKKALYSGARDDWEQMADHYGYEDPVPDHVQRKLQAIMGAVDAETATAAVRRARDSMLTHILACWARGRITGPESVTNFERRAKKAESLARMLEEKGLDDQAATQWRRAEDLQEKALKLRRETHGH